MKPDLKIQKDPPPPRRWRYVMYGAVPPGVDPLKTEGYVRAAVSWNDSMLPFLEGGPVEIETASGSGQFVPTTAHIHPV